MSTRSERLDQLVSIKTALAKKYDRMALATPSRHRRRSLIRRAERYRRQAAMLRRKLAPPSPPHRV